jgi:hypothetical protein
MKIGSEISSMILANGHSLSIMHPFYSRHAKNTTISSVEYELGHERETSQHLNCDHLKMIYGIKTYHGTVISK